MAISLGEQQVPLRTYCSLDPKEKNTSFIKQEQTWIVITLIVVKGQKNLT
jgi:hypothetical protein